MASKKQTKTTSSNHVKELEKLFKELMKLLGLNSSFDVSEDKTNNALVVNINSDEETGLIIGARGKTLSSLQMLTGIMLKNRTDEWTRVVINVSDYREKEEGRLIRLAEQTADRVLESGQVQNLYNLTPSQRRIVHMALSERSDVVTESQGEGPERYLAISPKK